MNRSASLPQSRPSLFRDLKYKGPFIADQRLRLLVLPKDNSVQAMDCFDLTGMRAGRRAAEDEGHSGESPLPHDCRWEPVTTRESRIELLANAAAHPRMLITIEAGIGKTTAVQQLLYLRNCSLPGHLALGAKLSELPDSHRKYLEGAGRINPWLVDLLANLDAFRDADPDVLLKLIRRKLVQGNLTLVVDAFDQTGRRDVDNETGRSKSDDQVQALAAFINRYPEIRLVCTGRPNSILDHRDELFGKGPWSVVQVAEFDESQIIRYIDQGRFDAIRETMDVELQSQPRMLEAIRELTPDQLRGLRTGAALHWKVIEKTVVHALRDQSRPPDLYSLWRLVSAIAFQMTFERNFDGVPEGDDFVEFADRLMRDRPDVGSRYGNDVSRLKKDLIEIGRLNELLDFAVMEEGSRIQLYFRNRTLQAFFAAMWVTRFSSTANERRWLQNHVYLGHVSCDGIVKCRYGNTDLYEFWRFLADVPGPQGRMQRFWLPSIAVLFQPINPLPPDCGGLIGSAVRRSTEMIWRAWWPLLEMARSVRFGSEQEMFIATNCLQNIVRQRFNDGELFWPFENSHSAIEKPSTDCTSPLFAMASTEGADLIANTQSALTHDALASRAGPTVGGTSISARFLLELYLVEFLALAAGLIGDRSQQALAATFDRQITNDAERLLPEHGFVRVPAGQFHYGEGKSATTENQTACFWLSRFPVTNELIRLFDPTHGSENESARYHRNYASFSPQPSCPANYIDWYTAWTLATWMHGMLPNERQWESGARGTFRPPLHARLFGFEGGDEQLCQYAWFDTNSEGRLHPVGGTSETKQPNCFGLFHVHGSVWEWTSNKGGKEPWYGKPMRCLRGGYFRGMSDLARCGTRGRHPVVDLSPFSGLRIARED